MALTGEFVPGTLSWAAEQVEEYESSGGTRGNTRHGLPVVILTMRGAKSGKIRKVPLMKVEHDGEYVVVASKGGAPDHPEWYHNLIADPEVELQDGPEPRSYTARLLAGDEREKWWEVAVEAFAPYADYKKKTSREIPVFLLEPR
jgi:deazaflavin-dependent oxidoreductase (nitroreductase family)